MSFSFDHVGEITYKASVGDADKVMEAAIEAGAEDAFSLAYVRPGMRKVNQALGRLVRAPGHSARVLLHCRRFADEAYRSLLSTEYGDPQVLTDDEEFVRWSARS